MEKPGSKDTTGRRKAISLIGHLIKIGTDGTQAAGSAPETTARKSGGSRPVSSEDESGDIEGGAAKAISPQKFAERLGLRFNNLNLLSRALTHRSYKNEHTDAVEDNERLEFLGDAILDFVVGAWLYRRYPEMLEGDLTRMRSALVYTEQLAEFGQKIGIGSALRLGKGEALAGGRERPGLLCDAFEAVIGAIYLDLGLDAVEAFISPMLEESAEEILANRSIEDPKSRFQEWVQSQGLSAPHYETRSTTGPDHSKQFEVVVLVDGKVFATGRGHSKQAAAKQAASNALEQLGLL